MPIFRGGMPGIFLGLTATPSVASGSRVPYDTQDWAEQWPTWASGVITAPRTGTYLVTVGWAAATLAAATTTTMTLRQNGVLQLQLDRSSSSAGAQRGTLSHLVRLVVGDTLDVQAVQTSGVARTFSPLLNTFRCVRVGPERWT